MNLVERLLDLDEKGYGPRTGSVGAEAAAEIARLESALAGEKNLTLSLAADIARLRASLPAAEDAQGWRPIETAPKGVAHVLLTDGERVFEGFFFGGKWLRAQNENLAFATHWQPIPAAPAMSQDSKEVGE